MPVGAVAVLGERFHCRVITWHCGVDQASDSSGEVPAHTILGSGHPFVVGSGQPFAVGSGHPFVVGSEHQFTVGSGHPFCGGIRANRLFFWKF